MEDYPHCPVCLDIFGSNLSHVRAPKVLNCGDCICKECLQNFIKKTDKDRFMCPKCQKYVAKEENVDKYITNNEIIKTINDYFINSTKIPENNEDNSTEYNVILLGNFYVGKTCIFNRLSNDIFSEFYCNTVGCDTTIYYIKYKEKNYRLIFHDPSGQERYRAITKSFLRNIDGVLFIFDISYKKSFDDLKSWYDLYKEVNENVVGLLIGNKCDCEHKEVSEKEAKKFAKKHGLKKYLETSAKLDKNIKKAVACLLEEILKSKQINNISQAEDRNFSLKPEILRTKKKCEC